MHILHIELSNRLQVDEDFHNHKGVMVFMVPMKMDHLPILLVLFLVPMKMDHHPHKILVLVRYLLLLVLFVVPM